MRARSRIAAALTLLMLLLPASVSAQGMPDPGGGAQGCIGLERQIFGAEWGSRIGMLHALLQGCAGAFVPQLRLPPGASGASSGGSGSPGSAPVSFRDLQGYGWATPAIDQLAQEGVINGISANAYDPAGTLTRAQTAALITRLFALKPPANPPAFADVPPSNWAYQDIEAAAPYMTQFQVPGGIAFEPTTQTTRIEIAATLGALEIASGKATEPTAAAAQSLWNQFSDGSQVTAGLAQIAAVALQLGFMKGFPNGTFGPEQSITRAQAAVLLDRVLQAGETMGQPAPLSTTANTLQVSGVSPAEAAAGSTVTITGSGLTGTYGVLFGGVASTSVSVVSDTELTAVVPPGSGTVQVTVNGARGSGTTTFTYTGGSTLQVTAVSPSEAPAGSQVTISGSGFTGATAVDFGSLAAASFSVQDDSTILATVPSGGSGTVDLTVTTPTGSSNASVTFTFGTGSSSTAPVVSSVSPSEAEPGATVTISGSGLTGATGVLFGGLPSTSFSVVGDSEITAIVPNGSGTVYVTVNTPLGTSAVSAQFTYGAGTSSTGAPSVASVSPSLGTAGTTVTLIGGNFSGATDVDFGGVPATSFSVISSTEITAVVPDGSGTVYVTVTGPYGTSAESAEFIYSGVSATTPTVTAVYPTSGAAGSTVDVTGSNFSGATQVYFGGTAATSFTVSSSDVISATAPAGSGSVYVTVTTPEGTSPQSVQFTYTGAVPNVTAVSPTSGAVGSLVTLTGSGFTGATTVDFGSTPASQITVTNDGSIVAEAPTPTGSSTTVTVTVTGPGGTSSSSGPTFTYTGCQTSVSGSVYCTG